MPRFGAIAWICAMGCARPAPAPAPAPAPPTPPSAMQGQPPSAVVKASVDCKPPMLRRVHLRDQIWVDSSKQDSFTGPVAEQLVLETPAELAAFVKRLAPDAALRRIHIDWDAEMVLVVVGGGGHKEQPAIGQFAGGPGSWEVRIDQTDAGQLARNEAIYEAAVFPRCSSFGWSISLGARPW